MTYGELKRLHRAAAERAATTSCPTWCSCSEGGVSRSSRLMMTLLAVPFAVTTGRRGALYGVGVGIVLAIVYWTR